MKSCGPTGCSSIPKSCIPLWGRRSSATSFSASADVRPTGRWSLSSQRTIRALREQIGDKANHLRPERGRGLVGGGRAPAPGRGQTVHQHLRGQWPATQGRSPKGEGIFRKESQAEPGCRGCRRSLPGKACRGRGSGEEAQNHRQRVHFSLRKRSAENFRESPF